MQRGHFYRAIGAWHLRYRVNGKQVSVKLAEYNDEYRTLKSVRPLGGLAPDLMSAYRTSRSQYLTRPVDSAFARTLGLSCSRPDTVLFVS